ncbi:MAG: aspartate kinase [Candidatus Micrarchaeota archaeon]
MIVMKFGGSCLGSKKDIEKTAAIIKRAKQPIVVLSAFKGITDELIKQANNALNGSYDITHIREFHYGVLADLSIENKVMVEKRIGELVDELNTTLRGISYLHELTPQSLDKVMSFGERLVIYPVAAYLRDFEIDAVPLSDAEAGIVTNDNFGNATILESSEVLVKQRVGELSRKQVPIITGFVGRTEEGRITTLGRGGSDYTATFIAATLGCEMHLLKDVDGIMSADPKTVENARVVKNVNYSDALELAHYGSKVIYEKAIEPLIKAHAPLVIKNFDTPDIEGTRISEKESTDVVVTAVKNVAIVNVHGRMGMMRVFAELVEALARKDVYPLLMTESSSQGEISIVVDEKQASGIEKLVKKSNGKVEGAAIEARSGYGLVAVIGEGMKKRVGTAASVFDALRDEKINIVAISQSASERNISVIVDAENVKRATKALHGKFIV